MAYLLTAISLWYLACLWSHIRVARYFKIPLNYFLLPAYPFEVLWQSVAEAFVSKETLEAMAEDFRGMDVKVFDNIEDATAYIAELEEKNKAGKE